MKAKKIEAEFNFSDCHALYRNGYYLQAYEHLSPFRENLTQWKNPDHLNIAGRLAKNLGNGKLGEYLLQRAYRFSNKSWKHTIFKAYSIFSYRGPLHAMRFLEESFRLMDRDEDDINSYMHALSLYAEAFAEARDFDSASRYMDKAREIDDKDLFTIISAARLSEKQERIQDSFDLINEALSIAPYYRPAVEYNGYLLATHEGIESAISYLSKSAPQMEYGRVYNSLAIYAEELNDYESMREHLKKAMSMSPMLSDVAIGWYHGRISDSYYFTGEMELAVGELQLAKGEFYEDRLKKMQSVVKDVYKRLEVPFVRQEHMTCAPAVLTALAMYWGLSVDQMEVVDEICYDGTPDYEERRWAEEHGFLVKEFTITWDTIVSLINKEIPFAFATASTESGHLQAIVGYSIARGTIFVREPSSAIYVEYDFDSIQKDQAPFGCRGMVMLPEDKQELIAELEFQNEQLYDHLHELRRCLSKNNRKLAEGSLRKIIEIDEDNLISLIAQLGVAAYDQRKEDALSIVDKLVERYPDCQRYQLSRFRYLKAVMDPELLLDTLLQQIEQTKGSPYLIREYARFLVDIPRYHKLARSLLLQATRSLGMDADCIQLLSRMYANRGDRVHATRYLRLSATKEYYDEWYNYNYFYESRSTSEWKDVLRYLEVRSDKLCDKFPHAGITLHKAYNEICDYQKSDQILEELLQRFPDDGNLLIYACRDRLYGSKRQWSYEVLGKIEQLVSEIDFLGIKGAVLSSRNEHEGALSVFRRLAQLDPHNSRTHARLVDLIYQQDGLDRSIEYIDEICSTYPHNRGIQDFAIDWLYSHDLNKCVQHVKSYLKVDTKNIWAHRQLVWSYLDLNLLDDARSELTQVLTVDNQSMGSYTLQGEVAAKQGDSQKAFSSWLKALSLSPSNTWIVERIFGLCQSHRQQLMMIEELQKIILKRGDAGGLLYGWYQELRSCSDLQSILLRLKHIYEQRDDLWQVHTCLANHYVEMDLLDDAERIYKQSLERFSDLPRLWLDLADLYEAKGDRESQKKAIESAIEISPTWVSSQLRLASYYSSEENYSEAENVMLGAVRSNPSDADAISYLGKIYEIQDREEDAIRQYKQALEVDPDSDWTWTQLGQLSRDESQQTALDLIALRPGDAELHFMLARSQYEDDVELAIETVDKAMQLSPITPKYADFKAYALCEEGRFDEAILVCEGMKLNGHIPIMLQRRRGIIFLIKDDLELAESAFLEIVKEEPHDYASWRQLSDLYLKKEQYEKCIEVSEKMEALFPRSAEALVHVADAHRLLGESEKARAVFRKALEISPKYGFASCHLFDLAFDVEDQEDIEFSLTCMLLDKSNPWVLFRKMRYELKQKERDLYLETLGELVSHEHVSYELMDEIQDLAIKHAAYDKMLPILSSGVQSGRACNNIEYWFGLKGLSANSYKDVRSFLKEKVGALQFVLAGLIERFAEKEKSRFVMKINNDYGEEFRKDGFCWGKLLYALVSIQDYRSVMVHADQWEQVDDQRDWPYCNIAVSYLRKKQTDEIIDLFMQVGKMVDLKQESSIGYYAFFAACAGEHSLAEEMLPSIPTEGTFTRFLRDCTKLLLQNDTLLAAGIKKLRKNYASQCSEKLFEEYRQIMGKTMRIALERVPGFSLKWRYWVFKIESWLSRL